METLILPSTRLGERMVSMSSTLVETVSINYEDFNESFLTCGTCLCMYDGSEHIPKLLPCSHTVCLQCLTRIAASQTRDTGSFRCPICRESITIPRGGVSALPPSFLVNQLLDLMARQRREVIPKCSVHNNQELLFCETCDIVFCTLCTNGNHIESSGASTATPSSPSILASLASSSVGSSSLSSASKTQTTTPPPEEHTIIPFSIAIKRMSEILLYKANECIGKLSQAQDGVTREIQRLDVSKENCLNQVNNTFQEILDLIEARKRDMVLAITDICNEKRKVLEEQHSLIDSEKFKVEQECEGLQYQVEVRNITQRISSLSEKLDAAQTLAEPRENSFISCNFDHNDRLKVIEDALQQIGRVRTSTTFPSLCVASVDDKRTIVVGLETTIRLVTVDYHGNARSSGGDPVSADVISLDSVIEILNVTVVDKENGTYDIKFRPKSATKYCIKISVFDRPIKDCPLFVDVSEHNNPIAVYGSRGSGENEFMYPVAVSIDKSFVYVLDTGNCRIKVLDLNLNFIRHINNSCLKGQSVTGMAISQNGLVVVNWRSKYVTEMSLQGTTIRSFTFHGFEEPTLVAVDRGYGHILVADNGANLIFVFDADGKFLFQVDSKKGAFQNLAAITVGHSGEIITADSRVQIFSAKGDFMEELQKDTCKSIKARYGHMVVDGNNRLLINRMEKGRNFIQIVSLDTRNVVSVINSNESRLKRPAGLAVTEDHHVIVADLCNDCLKKYRYW